ncbi:MAG: hypothetical protein OEZ06_28320 [Myxococcales bacterium]|nr:hypothetical protein [Myxococcales bacterium]
MTAISRIVRPHLLLVLLAVGAAGCLESDDDERILIVDLYWDDLSESEERFRGSKCSEAGVAEMRWRLVNQDGDEVAASDGFEPCANGIDIIDPDPGDYELELEGYSESDLDTDPDDPTPTWNVVCTGLSILRYDVGYACEIEAP